MVSSLIYFNCYIPKKKRCLGPQNVSGSSEPEKLLKIVNYQNCQKVVLSQLQKVGGNQYPPGSNIPIFKPKTSDVYWKSNVWQRVKKCNM